MAENYTRLQQLLNTAAGMTQSRAGSKNDDGTDTVPGAAWFKFNGAAANHLYVSGNLWVGFGVSGEQLKVWRRDAAVYNVWHQQGVVAGLRFCKLRVQGYLHYSTTAAENSITYEVFLLEDGRMVLNLCEPPTSSSYSGEHRLICGSESLTLPLTVGQKTVLTFTPADAENGRQWSMAEGVPRIGTFRFLAGSGGVLYTVRDGALTLLAETELTAALFAAQGTDDPPPPELLASLPDPTVYLWTDAPEAAPLQAQITADPPDQTLEIVCNMSHPSITGLAAVSGTGSDTVTVQYSTDDGAAYTAPLPLPDFLAQDTAALWAALPTDRRLPLRFTLHGNDTLTQVKFTFANGGK